MVEAGKMSGGPGITGKLFQQLAVGSSGTEVSGGYFSEEYLSKLHGQRGAKIYDEMRRSEPIIRMLLSAVINTIKKAQWEFEPGEPGNEEYKKHAEFAEFNFKQLISFENFKQEALSFIPQGFSLFEEVHQVVESHPKYGTFVGLKALAFRSQKTIYAWKLEQGTGKILNVEQLATTDVAFNSSVKLPGEFLLVFSNEKEGDNYEGISALRSMYGSWIRKNLYHKLAAIGVEKYALGTPIGTVPAGKEKSDEVAAFESLLSSYTSNEKAYLIIPEGWKIEIIKQDFDADKIKELILLENTEMTNSMLANFLALGMNSGGGSRSLATDLIDFFESANQTYADQIAEVLSRASIPRLIKMNFGPQECYPKIKVKGIEESAGLELANALKALKDGGYINPDPELEESIRKRYGLTKKPELQPTAVVAAPTQQFSDSMKLSEEFANSIDKNKVIVQDLMGTGLSDIYAAIKAKLAREYAKAAPAQKNSVFTKLDNASLVSGYAASLEDELARIAYEAQSKARSSLPRTKLAEESMQFAAPRGGFFDALSPKVKRLVKSQAALVADTQVADLEKVTYFQFASSAAASEDIDAILADIDEKVSPTLKEVKVGNISTAAGDVVAQVANQARIDVYFEPEAFESIESFTFVNEDPVSEICQSLEGTTLAPGDADFMRYQTPLHHNCKSHWAPNFKGAKDSPEIDRGGLSLSKKALGSITLAEVSLHKVFSSA